MRTERNEHAAEGERCDPDSTDDRGDGAERQRLRSHALDRVVFGDGTHVVWTVRHDVVDEALAHEERDARADDARKPDAADGEADIATRIRHVGGDGRFRAARFDREIDRELALLTLRDRDARVCGFRAGRGDVDDVLAGLERDRGRELVVRDARAIDFHFGGRSAVHDDVNLAHVRRERRDAIVRGRDDVLRVRLASPEMRRAIERCERGALLPERIETRRDAIFDLRRVARLGDATEFLERDGHAASILIDERLGKKHARALEVVRSLRRRARREESASDNDRAHVTHRPNHLSMHRVTNRDATESMMSVRTPARGVPRVTATSGPGAGAALAMRQSMATVGRHETNDLVLSDPNVSGVHLSLTRDGELVHVRDAKSTNGTWLGGHRIVDVILAPGAEITVGATTLRFDVDGAAAPAEASDKESFGALVGRSVAMRELFATLERIAPKQLSVLVEGETGTGKEEVARAIHAASPRASQPFVVIDATSLPESLAEALLFGHEKGAFTGANERREGFFEAASGGTVFIDEIGELPAALQSKFLRVLERHEVVRVGHHAPTPVDVRVIAATHRDLRNEIEAGNFREDLFFRLGQIRLRIPPLRDRPEDIPTLCAKLLEAITPSSQQHTVDPSALDHLRAQPWPGNVRELRNVLARAAALCEGNVIRRSDVAGEGDGFRGTREERAALDVSGKFADAKAAAIERFESAYLAALMKRAGGNLSRAAREADVARHHLRDLLKKRGLYGASLDDGE